MVPRLFCPGRRCVSIAPGGVSKCAMRKGWGRRSDETDVALFAGLGRGGEVFGLSHHAATDAFHVGVDAPLTEQGFALRAFEDFASAVNPAGTPTEGVGGVEQIAYHKRTVVEVGGPRRP